MAKRNANRFPSRLTVKIDAADSPAPEAEGLRAAPGILRA
jgi:hypothetical protein